MGSHLPQSLVLGNRPDSHLGRPAQQKEPAQERLRCDVEPDPGPDLGRVVCARHVVKEEILHQTTGRLA